MTRRPFVAAAAVAAAGLVLQYAPWPQPWLDAGFMGWWFPRLTRVTARLAAGVGWSLSAALLAAWLLGLALCALAALVGRRRVGLGGGSRRRSGVGTGDVRRGRHGPWRPFRLALAWPAALLVTAFPLTFGLAYRVSDLKSAVAERKAGRSVDPWVAHAGGESLAYRLVAVLTATAPGAAEDHPVAGAASEPATSATASSVTGSAADLPPALGAAAARCVARTAGALRREFLPATLAPGARRATAAADAGLPAVPDRFKTLPAGTLLRGGYAGIVSPWLLEPHVDAGLPAAAGLAVALHEFAHTAGFAREAEAEAVGLVAGLTCDDPDVRYAAALSLARSLLAAASADEEREYLAAWPERARQDARAAEAAARRYRTPALQRATDAVYATYLRSQGGSEGLGEYAGGTALALALIGGGLAPP